MKKLLLFFCGAVLLCASCDPMGNRWQWLIKNSTDQTLKLKYIDYTPHNPTYGERIIFPGDSIEIYGVGFEARKKMTLHFDDYFNNVVRERGEDVYWQLLSEDDVVLKTWNYSDKDLQDQRFFEESSWRHYKKLGGDAWTITVRSWVFDVLSEDISSD